MSPTPNDPRKTAPRDPLLQRYQEANALDKTRPSEALRQTVLAHAQSQAKTPTPAPPALTKRPAANDNQWAWRALGSLAVLGFVGLLVMQFERGTPAEQKVALGAPDPRADAYVSEPQASASVAAPATELPERQRDEGATASTRSKPAPPAIAEAETVAPTPPPAAPEQSMPAANAMAPDAMGSTEKPASTAPMADAKQAAPAKRMARVPVPPPSGAAPATPATPQADALAAMAKAPSTSPASTAPNALRESPQRARREGAGENPIAGQAASRGPTASGSAQAPLPALHAAVAKGDLSAALGLLAQGANINRRDDLGRTALMVAAMGHQKNMVVALMDAGADAALIDQAQLSAADHARRAGHADWLPLLQPRR